MDSYEKRDAEWQAAKVALVKATAEWKMAKSRLDAAMKPYKDALVAARRRKEDARAAWEEQIRLMREYVKKSGMYDAPPDDDESY